MIVHVLPLMILACAVSLDGFGAGVTYGLRNIRIPMVSTIIIALCSGFVIWVSMAAGTLITGWLPPAITKLAGAILLIGIGVWTLIQWFRSQETTAAQAAEPDDIAGGVARDAESAAVQLATVWRLELKRAGLVIEILRSPQAADVDRSGVISASEALLLGFALSLDAFGAGLGMAMLGFPPVLTALLIAAASGLFLRCGMSVGFRVAGWRGVRALSMLPGLILILMGMTRLL